MQLTISRLFTVTSILILWPTVLLSQVFTGQVQHELTWEPIPYAVVILKDADYQRLAHVSSDENGFYEISAPAPGEYFIEVQRIGYTRVEGGPLPIGESDTLRVRFQLLEEAVIMDELTVMAERYNERLIDDYLDQVRFTSRMRSSIGRFMTRDDLKDLRVNRTSDLFLNVQGVTLSGGVLYSTRYNCPVKVVLNGFEIASSTTTTFEEYGDTPPLFSVDALVNHDNIVGIEVYPGLIGQPAQFGTKSRCGLVAIWTR